MSVPADVCSNVSVGTFGKFLCWTQLAGVPGRIAGPVLVHDPPIASVAGLLGWVTSYQVLDPFLFVSCFPFWGVKQKIGARMIRMTWARVIIMAWVSGPQGQVIIIFWIRVIITALPYFSQGIFCKIFLCLIVCEKMVHCIMSQNYTYRAIQELGINSIRSF